jgi:endonuclease/exonuclease/phosphatase family metal-dependent hydrolase
LISQFRRAAGIASLAATAIAVGALAAPAGAANVTVETRNIYLGADLAPALGAPNTTELAEEAGKIWRAMQDTNFTARAKILAQEIDEQNPRLVGLQEVSLWRRDEFGNPNGPLEPAEEVVYDFLDDLRQELRRRGLNYKPKVMQQEADLELPVDFVDNSSSAETRWDGRLTMFDVILVRKGTETSNPQSDNYDTLLTVPTPGLPTTVHRGWTAIDAKVGDSKFRFVNTHLEAFSAAVREAQANELLADGGPLDTNRQVILVGDLNSDPDGGSPGAYNAFTDAGFVDVGVGVDTCCHDADLLNSSASFDSRIDHILARPAVTELSSVLLGAGPRTPHGMWPSDHGGVVSRLGL